MALTLTTADAALKEHYQPAIREQLNNENMLLSQVNKNTEDFEGRRAVLSVHVSRNSGVGPRAESATLPTAGSQGHAEERIPTKGNYGRIELSGWVIKAMKSDAGSFTRAVSLEVDGVTADLKRSVNRDLFTPASNIFATATAGSTTTATVTTLTEARYFEAGMVVDVFQGTADTIRQSGFIVSSVDLDTLVVTFTAAGTAPQAGDTIGLTTVVPSANTALTGLEEIVAASGTLFNINPSTHPVWVSYVNAVAAPPSDTVIQEALDETLIRGGTQPDLLIGSHEVVRAYGNTLKTIKRFSDSIELKGGFSGTSVDAGRGPVALMPERDCPTDSLYGLSTKHLIEFELCDWEFMDEDGAVLSRVANTHAYEATLYKLHELATDKRNSHFRLTGLSV